MLQKFGVAVAIITGRKARCVELRMQNLGIDLLFQGVENKWETMQSLLAQLGINADEAGYMGDDVVDLPVMTACGFSAAPADAHDLVKRYARMLANKAWMVRATMERTVTTPTTSLATPPCTSWIKTGACNTR